MRLFSMDRNVSLLVTGGSGMVGKALLNLLKQKGYRNILAPSSEKLDLLNEEKIIRYFKTHQIDMIIHLAAKVGGISANMENQAGFLYDNVMLNSLLFKNAHDFSVKKIINFGSSCIYPPSAPKPFEEKSLLQGSFEPTNEGYALGKIVGIKLGEYYNKQYAANYLTLIPPNLYGPHDHFNLKTSHVISALLKKCHHAKINGEKNFIVWGSGEAQREFLYVTDIADACVFFLEKDDANLGCLNIGTGESIKIKELAALIKNIVGFTGDIIFDQTKPDGMLVKYMNTQKASNVGWKYKVSLEEGLKRTYTWYLKQLEKDVSL